MNTHVAPGNKNRMDLTTCNGIEDVSQKQIGYMMVGRKRQNWVTQINTKGTANTGPQYLRKIGSAKIRIKLKRTQ